MSKCKINIQTFAEFTKKLLAQDAKYKDFSEVASFIIKRPGQTDATKMVALKGLAKIYEQLAKKDTSFIFSEDDSKVIDVDLEQDDLDVQYKKLAIQYSVRAAASPTLDGIKNRITKLSGLSAVQMQDEIVSIIKDIKALAKTNFRKNTEDMLTALGNLFDRLAAAVENNPSVSPTIKNALRNIVQKEKNLATQAESQYVPIKNTFYGDTKLIIRPDGRAIEVLQDATTGKFYDVNNQEQEIIFDRKAGDELYNLRADGFFTVSNDGTRLMLTRGELDNGMSFRDRSNKEITKHLIASGTPIGAVQIVASKVSVKNNRDRLNRIKPEIPNRTLETQEVAAQQKALLQGKPVLTVFNPIDGFQLQFRVPGIKKEAILYGVDNFAIVYPDNRTEPVTFSEAQKELFLKLAEKQVTLDTGVTVTQPMTEQDFYTLKARYEQFLNLKKAVQEIVDQNPDQDEVEIPSAVVSEYINLVPSNPVYDTSDPGEQPSLTSVLSQQNGAGQITFSVVEATDDGYSEPRQVTKPILVTKDREEEGWRFVSDLKGNEYVVVEKDGKTEYMSYPDYLQKVLKIDGQIKVERPVTNHAWIYVKPDGSVKQVFLRYEQTNNNGDIIKFALAAGEFLKKAKDPATKPTAKDIRAFNRDVFGFNASAPVGGTPFYMDFDVFKASRDSNDYSLSIQMKPTTINFSSLDRDVIRAMTVYIDSPVMEAFLNSVRTAALSSEFAKQKQDLSTAQGKEALVNFILQDPQLRKKVTQAWEDINTHVRKKVEAIPNKLQNTSYNGEFTAPTLSMLMEQNLNDPKKMFELKLKNRQALRDISDVNNYRTLTTESVFKFTSIKPVFNGTVAAAVSPVGDVVNPPSNPLNNTTGTPVQGTTPTTEIDLNYEDDPFSLLEDELFEAYLPGQFEEELKWIQENLPADISVEDLADIMDELKVEGRVLGYFRDRVIYMNEQLSSRGTGYHEAFHGVFRKLMDQSTRRRYLDLTLNKMGSISKEQVDSFREKRGYFHLSDEQIKDRIAEEYLADKFKAYKLENKQPQEGWLQKLINLLDKIIRFFNKNYKAIDDLFMKIDTGFYKDAQIVGEFKEGAFAMLPTRSTLYIGPNGKAVQRKNYLNKTEQNQLVNRLAELASFNVGTFEEKFDAAKKELIKELDINNLIAQNPSQEKAIRDKYEQTLKDKLYALGVAQDYYNETGDPTLDNNLGVIMNNEASKQRYTEQQREALESLKKQVKDKLDKISISKVYFDPEAGLSEDDEADIEEYGDQADFEDSFVNMNSLDGLSRQFRSLFGLISYVQTDELGVQTIKMVDGVAMFDTVMKILADTPVENMMNKMRETVDKMKESENELAYERFNAMWSKMSAIFGLDEETLQPTRNLNLYNQFIDTFNVVDLATDVFVIKTQNNTSSYFIQEATIQNDINQYYEKLRRSYEKKFMNRPLEEREKLLKEAKSIIRSEVLTPADMGSKEFPGLKERAKKVQKALKSIGLDFTLDTIIYSFVAIDAENGVELGKKANRIYLADQDLANTGAYLQKDFFVRLVRVVDANTNIFDKTVDKDVAYAGTIGMTDAEKNELNIKKRGINLINAVIKKTGKYAVKYDMDTVVSVFRNAEGKNVYRYVKMTPPLIISQSIQEKGWKKTYEDFPIVQRFLKDNPLTANKADLKLYLQNLELRAFGGARQTLKGVENDGVTSKTIDTAGYYLSYILMAMNRKTITQGDTTITTFNRMLTQNEASNTVYMVPNLYKRMVSKDGYVNVDEKNSVVNEFVKVIQQEYNRIQREWATRDDKKEHYNKYNGTLNPDGSVNTSDPSLRAYKFNLLADFFEFDNSGSKAQNKARAVLRDALIQKAKDGAKFSSLNLAELESELLKYAEEKFENHLDILKKAGLVQEDDSTGELKSTLIPSNYTIDGEKESVENDGTDLRSFLKDIYFNVFTNNLQVSQFFDGDIALGVKNFADYFKRQKMNVAAGPNMKSGNHTIAIVDNIEFFINPDDLEQGQYDPDDTIPDEINKANFTKVAGFDGQSITTIEHRIEQYRKQGRLSEDPTTAMSVESILKASRYRKMTEEEVKFLNENKVVLGPKKTVTGALIHYHKQAEHLLFRTDSSYIVVPEGMTHAEVEKKLEELYNKADGFRNRLRNSDTYEVQEDEVVFLQDELRKVYREIHRYWEPMPHRSAHHYMLNSMEMHDIDQLMDPTASKKATVLPVKLNNKGVTDLSRSRLTIPNQYKFDQVETAKISTDISATTQLMHLIDADINLNDKNIDSNLKDAVQQFRKIVGRLGEVSLNRLNNLIKDEEGYLDVRAIIKSMRDSLESQGADSNTLKFFELQDDQPVHNVNLPLIKKMFTFHYFSFYSNNVFNRRQSGRKDYLVTSWGYKIVEEISTGKIVKSEEIAKDPSKYSDSSKYKIRYPGIKYDKEKNTYYVEVIVPRPFFKNQQELELFERKLSTWLSTRIPTEDKRSMMVAKAVDFMDAAYGNAIAVPQAIHILSGSDLDIDSLYSHTFATYTDFNGNQRVYGEANTPQEQFVEYLQSMMEDESIQSLIKLELDKVYKEDVAEIPEALESLAEELNLPWHNYTKDQLRAFINEQREIRNAAYTKVQQDKERKAQIKEIYLKVRSENEAKVKKIEDEVAEEYRDEKLTPEEFFDLVQIRVYEDNINFREQGKLSAEYRKAKSVVDKGYLELEVAGKRIKKSQEEIDRISRLMKVIATLNVLAKKKMPVTANTYARETSRKESLVVEVLQNDLLQAKMDILGSEQVFRNIYINQSSNVKKYEDMATQMGKKVVDVVNKNNIFSPDGIIGSRDMVRSSNAGIGIAANTNKFAAFASKKGLKLVYPIWSVNGKDYVDFTPDGDSRPIEDIGNILGMQADAKSNPIPAVLNLNEVSLPLTLAMIAQKLPVEMAIAINSVPMIAEVVQRVMEEKRGIRSLADLFNKRSLRSISADVIADAMDKLKQDGEHGLLFMLDEDGNIAYDKKGNPVFRNDLDLRFKWDTTPGERTNSAELGFSLTNASGSVSENGTQLYLLFKYLQTNALNGDMLAVTSILNLYKKLKPSWKAVDRILLNYAYLTGKTERQPLFANIKDVLEKSPEFKPLIKAVGELSENAESILIERNPVMTAILDAIKGGLQTWALDEYTEERVNDMVTKYFIINKFRSEAEKELQELRLEEKPNQNKIQALTDALEMFTSDFWKGSPSEQVTSLEDDFEYLKEYHENNAFVDYLKERSRQGVTLIEALSRMKLEKEQAENIIDGYSLLETSPDKRTALIARKLFHYILIKDGLGYGSNTFINYLNPANRETFVKISKYLNDLQKELVDFNKKNRASFSKGKADVYYKKFNDLLNNFFGKKVDLNTYMSSIVTRIGLYAGNTDLMVKGRTIKTKGKNSRFKNVDNAIIKAELSQILPETADLEPKNIYTELEENPEGIHAWLPTSKEIDKGRVVIDTTATSSMVGFNLLSQMNIQQRGSENDEKLYSFPLFVKNPFGTVLKLVDIDGQRVSDVIVRNLTKKLQGNPYASQVVGKKAVYVVTEQEGNNSILNLGMNESEARELYKFSKQESENVYLGVAPTERLEEALQRLRNVWKVEPKRLDYLMRIIKSEVLNNGAITFSNLKNNVFFLSYTVSDEKRGPVQRKLFIRPSKTNPLHISLEIREREIVTGAENIVEIDDNLKDFKAVDLEYYPSGKQYGKKAVNNNPTTQEKIDELIKNYTIPEGYKLKTKLSFADWANMRFKNDGANTNLEAVVRGYNKTQLEKIAEQNQNPVVTPASTATGDIVIPAGFVLKPNARPFKDWLKDIQTIPGEDRSIEQLKAFYLQIFTVPEAKEKKDDLDSGCKYDIDAQL